MASVKKVKDASIVSVSVEDNPELSVQFNSPELNEQISNALDVHKENMIVAQAEIMQIELFADDIKTIKKGLGDEYRNAASLEVAIVNALVDYQEGLEAIVDAATTQAMQRLAAMQNRSSARSKAKWGEMQSKAKELTKEWESVKDYAIDTFEVKL